MATGLMYARVRPLASGLRPLIRIPGLARVRGVGRRLFDSRTAGSSRYPASVPDHRQKELSVQGVIKAYDPATGSGVVVRDTDLAEFDLAPDALDGSVFRMLRQGQRVLFDLLGEQATGLRLGSEVDMGTPSFLTPAGEESRP